MPTDPHSAEQAAARAARAVHRAYTAFEQRFNEITRRAERRFLERDWSAARADAAERLELYPRALDDVVRGVDDLLAWRRADEGVWRRIRRHYAREIAWEQNDELAKTFFNSVTRRIFATVGVNPAVEFLSRASPVVRDTAEARRHEYPVPPKTDALFRDLLARAFPAGRYRDLAGDAARAAAEVRRFLLGRLGTDHVESLETLQRRFFRDRGAYLIGRLRCANTIVPLVLALRHEADGIAVDAVLTHEDDVSILFSFTRAYFQVGSPCPRRLVVFLKSIMPLKPVSELYTALGFHRHGKTELYRDLMHHLARSTDRFEIAEGEPGMVMLVFTLRGYDVVFKIIRDRFAYPKSSTRRDVVERYNFVFHRDRVGRLIDAQQFEHLSFSREMFDPALLDELLREAAETVAVRGDAVVIRHLYTERKVTPLDVYLRRSFEDAATRAVIDYGQAIRELCAANVFPGDFLLKNFGVTRHHRIVFYDYDELCLVTDCNFRELPAPRNAEEELEAEAWFTVGEHDIFPEEFRRFLGLGGRLREVFERHHGDLFRAAWWRELQARLAAGEFPDVRPYPDARRLRR